MRQLQAYRDVLEGAFVCIMTTSSSERKAALRALDAHRKLATSDPSKRAYLGVRNARLVLVLDGEGAFSGQSAASRWVTDFLANERYPRPAVVVLCGVCWGNPQLAEVGQVLVATTLISVNRTEMEPSGKLSAKPKTFESLLPEEIVYELREERAIAPAVMLSLEQLVRSTVIRNEYVARFPSAHGGEMEGFAVVPSCAEKAIPWLVIKAVSDFGDDDFHRGDQESAATAAAKLLARHVADFPFGVRFDEDKEDERRQLIDVIRGHAFDLRREEFSDGKHLPLQINQALRGLEHVIAFYTGSTTIHSHLASHLARLIKELALNAFRHGRATRVRVDVDPGGVSVDDDGESFSLGTLESSDKGRGGQTAWLGFKRDHVKNGRLEVTNEQRKKWSNSVRFVIENPHPQLPEAKEKCRAVIDLRDEPAIFVLPECNDVYIDVRRVEMMTLALDTVDEFRPLLQSGKRLFVALNDPDIREKVENAFSEELKNGQLTLLTDGSPQSAWLFGDA